MKIPKGFDFSVFPPYEDMVRQAIREGACSMAVTVLRKYSSTQQLVMNCSRLRILDFLEWYIDLLPPSAIAVAERLFLCTVEDAFYYFRFTRRKRWEEAEPLFREDFRIWGMYLDWLREWGQELPPEEKESIA